MLDRGAQAAVRQEGAKVKLVPIAKPQFDVELSLAYATADNITGKPVYARADCYLLEPAAAALQRAIAQAAALGLRLRLFDALRPTEAQWKLWNFNPDPNFLADPRRGSPHSMGAAVDLTLVEGPGGAELDMGTGFDDMRPLSWHGDTAIQPAAQRHRTILLGLMTAAGWDFYRNEWWHYQLFDARRYPLVSDADLPRPMM